MWQSGQPVEYGEYFMGHEDAFDKYGYDKTYRDEADLREKYKAALPWLNLLSSNKPYDLVSRGEAESEELQSLRVQLEKLTKDMSLINQLLEDPDAKVPMWQAMEIMKAKKASTQA